MKSTKTNSSTRKRFNIVDATIILILVLIVAGIGWKIISAKVAAAKAAAAAEDAQQQEEEKELSLREFNAEPHVRFTVECPDIPLAGAENAQSSIADGETQIFNNNQMASAYITDCYYRQDAVDESLYTLYFTIEALYGEEEEERFEEYHLFSAGNQEVRVGKPYIVKTQMIEFNGFITSREVVNE